MARTAGGSRDMIMNAAKAIIAIWMDRNIHIISRTPTD
jgi:hypothetical protein